MKTFVALLLSAIVLTGCASTSQPPADDELSAAPSTTGSTEPGPVPSPSPTKVPRKDRRVIGHFIGVDVRSVREFYAEQEIAVETEVERDCRRLPGIVFAQDPAPGSRAVVGDTVTVTIGRPPAAATCVRPPARPVTMAFYDWSRGEGPAPAFAPEVRLLVGDRPTATLTAAEAATRDAWQVPPYAEYAEMNLLDWMADQPLLQHAWGITPHCLVHQQALPQGLVDRLWWSSALLVSSADACMQVAAIQVWVDGGDRISAVNYLSGAP